MRGSRAAGLLQALDGALVEEVFVGRLNLLRILLVSNGHRASIRTWGCPWCISDGRRIVAGSDDEAREPVALPQLSQQNIMSVEIDEATKTLSLGLRNLAKLQLFVSQSKGDRHSLQWAVHFGDGVILNVRAGGRWQLERPASVVSEHPT